MPDIEEQYYELHIGGKRLDEYYLSLIEEIIHEDNATGSDLLHVTINDPDFIFIDDSFFIEETPVYFLGGWMGDTMSFDGFISVIDVDLPASGNPSLVIHCMDNSHVMNREKKKRTWTKTKMSTVASLIFSEHGLIPVVDDTVKIEETISQSNATDIAFLIDRAKDQDSEFICYVEGNKGYFVKRAILATPQDSLDYRSGNGRLFSFRPRINKESKQEKINKDNIDSSTGETKSDSASNDDIRELQGTPTSGKKYIGGGVWEDWRDE